MIQETRAKTPSAGILKDSASIGVMRGSSSGIPSETPPLPSSTAWFAWRQARVNYWDARAQNATVDATYYFAASGSDLNDGLTTGTPKQTLAAANALMVGAQRVRILFNRGDKFIGGLTTSGSGVFKIGAYGSGSKPSITTFNGTGYADADNAWTLDTGNMYRKTTAPTKAIGWIREVANPYNPYMYLTTTALVQLLPYSWTQTIGSATFTANSGTDVFTSVGHGLTLNKIVWLDNSGGALPGNVSRRTNYFVINPTADTFQLSLTSGGSAINISSNGSGTNTWYTMTGLYINMGGTDPNTVNLEVTPDFNDHTEGWANTTSGAGNIYLIEDVIFDGHGAVPGQDSGIACYGLHANARNTDIFVVKRCETYYNGRHGIGHTNGGDGGVFVVRDSGAGYCSIDATSFVSFGTGTGLESHYENTYNPFGKLPSNDYAGLYGGPAYHGGPSSSGIYAHTGGVGTLKMFSVWNHDFQDNRLTFNRATYEIGDITGANLRGTATDLSSIRAWFNHSPIVRLAEIDPAVVTIDATNDIVLHSGNTYNDGDFVMLQASTTMPGNVTARKPYAVINRDSNGYQLTTESIYVSSIDASTDTITCISATSFSNGSRVKIMAEYGQLPGGLSSSILYYVVGLSGANLQLSLTSGGAPVDITDQGFGRFRLYGAIVNISSAGSGTITAIGVRGNSAAIRAAYASPAVYINCAKTGLNWQTYGSAINNFSFNEIILALNAGHGVGSVYGGGSLTYNGHYRFRTRGGFWYLGVISNGTAQLFNSIVDNQGFVTALNVTNDTDHMRGNALYDPNGVLASLTSSDDYKVSLTASPDAGSAPLSTFDNEGFPNPNNISLEYDFFGATRNANTPSIGPVKG